MQFAQDIFRRAFLLSVSAVECLESITNPAHKRIKGRKAGRDFMTTEQMRLWHEGKSYIDALAKKGVVTLKPSSSAISELARELDLTASHVRKCIDIYNFEF